MRYKNDTNTYYAILKNFSSIFCILYKKSKKSQVFSPDFGENLGFFAHISDFAVSCLQIVQKLLHPTQQLLSLGGTEPGRHLRLDLLVNLVHLLHLLFP